MMKDRLESSFGERLVFVPTGKIRLSAGARGEILAFLEMFGTPPTGGDKVASLTWHFAMEVFEPDGTLRERVGPGVWLGLSSRSDFPKDAIATAAGIDLVVQVDPSWLRPDGSVLVDLDAAGHVAIVR